MELYLILLKNLLNRELYNKYYRYINKDQLKDNYPFIYKLYNCLEEFYSSKETTNNPTVEDLFIVLRTRYPRESEEEISKVQQKILSIENQVNSIGKLLHEYKLRYVANSILEVSSTYLDGFTTSESVFDRAKEFVEVFSNDAIEEEQEQSLVNFDLENLIATQAATPGLEWRLPSLNKNLGPIGSGNFGFIFARPETGKTSFLASEVSYMAGQTRGEPVVWFNNEEPGDSVALRIYQATLGLTRSEIEKDVRSAQSAFSNRTGSCIKLFDSGYTSKQEVERIVSDISPRLLVFDQLDKIRGFKTQERHDLALGTIYQWARELAKEYKCSVIGVCQADGTAEGVRRLTMEHVSNAKTSKQAEADWILGIGKSHQEGFEQIRYFSLCKNKLPGGKDRDENMRHGFWEVLLRPEIARYEDLY